MLRILAITVLGSATTIAFHAQLGPPRRTDGSNSSSNAALGLTPDEFIRQFEANQLPLPLLPKEKASEAEQERAHSLALFGKARLKQQQEKYDEALSAYQRAYRWNPSADSILWDIVPLAFYLDRQGVAIRYATLANEKAPRDPKLIQQLAMMLLSQDEFGRARKLIDAAIRIHKKQDLLLVSLHFDRARTCLFQEDFQAGADSLDIVHQAIDAPAAFETNKEDINTRLGSDTTWNTLAAELYLKAGRLPEAKKAFETLDALIEIPAIRSFHQARLAVQSGTWDVALRELDSYFEQQSSKAGEQPYELLEEILVQRSGNVPGSAELSKRLGQLVDENPANEPLALFVARKLQRRNQHARVVELLQPFVDETVSVETMQMLLDAQIALENPRAIFTGLGQLATLWKKVVGQPVLPDSEVVDKLLSQESLLRSVLNEAQTRLADRRRPIVFEESFMIAQLCLKAEDFRNADKFFEHSLETIDDPGMREQLRLTWAEECYFVDHLPPAIEGFRHALTYADDDVNVDGLSELLATALELDGQTQTALEILDEACLRSPDAVDLALRRAWIHLHADQTAQAITAYQRVIEAFGNQYDSEETRLSVRNARITLSGLHVAEGNPSASSELLLTVLDEYPEDVGALNDLGYLWADQGIHVHRAKQMVEQAVAAEPQNPAYLDSLGWVYFRLGRLDKALPPLLQAVEILKEPDGVILDHLGDVYNSLNDREQAIATWQRAADSFVEADAPDDAERVRAKIDQGQSPNVSDNK